MAGRPDINSADFIHNYQKILFKENGGDQFVKCNFKRQCMHQILHTSQKL